MKPLDNSQLDNILEPIFQDMIAINPKMKTDHPVMDFVCENFADRVKKKHPLVYDLYMFKVQTWYTNRKHRQTFNK